MCLVGLAAHKTLSKKAAEGRDKTAVNALAAKGGTVLGGAVADKALVTKAEPQAPKAGKAVKKNANQALQIARNY